MFEETRNWEKRPCGRDFRTINIYVSRSDNIR